MKVNLLMDKKIGILLNRVVVHDHKRQNREDDRDFHDRRDRLNVAL